MSLNRREPCTGQRGKDGSVDVRSDFAALWLACGYCQPGPSCHTVAHPLCHPACPWWLVPRLRPGSSQYYTQSRVDPGALFAAADLFLGLAHLLARIPREPALDLAAASRPAPGHPDRHSRGLTSLPRPV